MDVSGVGPSSDRLPCNAQSAVTVVAADPQVAKDAARCFDEVPVASAGYTICGAYPVGHPYRLGFRA